MDETMKGVANDGQDVDAGCPFRIAADKRLQEYAAMVAEEREKIEKCLRGLYSDADAAVECLSAAIDNAAAQGAKIRLVEREALMYPMLQVKKSREGNDSFVLNPIHENLRTMRATYKSMLEALGIKADPGKVETSIVRGKGVATETNTGDGPTGGFVRNFLESLG